MANDDEMMRTALARMHRAMAGIGAGGALGLALVYGWTHGAGFGLGAAVSWLNFRWLKQIVEALGGGRVRGRLAVWMGFRYLLMGAGAYVIVSFTPISLPAALAGLFAAPAAVIFEILFQLIYARV
jgi:hypothetical protein